MESNINHSAIDEYGIKFTQNICDQFFTGKIYIKADEILLLTPVQQVNYFVLKELFQRWKSEISQLKSPYFDYDNDEVQTSLKAFMNVLSRHILIKREDLEPLVIEAIHKAIIMIFSPYEFFLQEINNPDFKQVSIQDLKDLQKYIKVNEHLLNTYIKKFENEGIEAVFNDDAIRMFNEVVESTGETPEEFDLFLKQFSEVLPLTDEIVFSPTVPQSGSGQIQEDDPPARKESEEIVQEAPSEQSTMTIHDSLHVEQHDTLADIHRKQPIASIKTSITLNQRFMFVNDLFNGSMDDFEMAIGVLENCSNVDEAMEFIETNYFNKNIWDSEKEEVQEFVEVVQRRFPQ